MTQGRWATLLITAGTFGGAIAQWFLVWLFARQGGASAVGEFSALFAIATPVFVTAQFGLRNVYLTLARRYPFATYVILRALGALAGAGVLIGLGLVLGFPPVLILAMTALKVIDSALDMGYAHLQSSKRLVRLGAIMVVNPLLTIALAAVVVSTTGSVAGGVLASAMSSAAVAVLALLAILRHPGQSLRPTRPTGYGAILSAATPVMLTQMMVALLTYIPVWITQAGGGIREVGLYAGASYLLVVANILGSSLSTVLLPSYRGIHARGESLVKTVFAGCRRWIALGLAGLVVAVLAGPSVLGWVYGPEFALPHWDILLLSVAAVMAVPTYLLNAGMLVKNRYRSQTVVSLLAVLTAGGAGAVSLLWWDPVTSACIAALSGAAMRAGGSLLDFLRS